MAKYGVLVTLEMYYEIEAPNEEVAAEKGCDYFAEAEPFVEVNEITE